MSKAISSWGSRPSLPGFKIYAPSTIHKPALITLADWAPRRPGKVRSAGVCTSLRAAGDKDGESGTGQEGGGLGQGEYSLTRDRTAHYTTPLPPRRPSSAGFRPGFPPCLSSGFHLFQRTPTHLQGGIPSSHTSQDPRPVKTRAEGVPGERQEGAEEVPQSPGPPAVSPLPRDTPVPPRYSGIFLQVVQPMQSPRRGRGSILVSAGPN